MRNRSATRCAITHTAITVAAMGFCGCSPSSDAVPEVTAPEQRFEFTTTPELLKLFGGQKNLSEVQHAWSSTQISLPVAMYAGDRVRRLSEMVGTAESYDFSKPVEGDFVRDLTADFTGPEYWDAKNKKTDPNVRPVTVHFDMTRRILEVRIGEQVHGRASFEPVAPRLDAYFQKLGYFPKPR